MLVREQVLAHEHVAQRVLAPGPAAAERLERDNVERHDEKERQQQAPRFFPQKRAESLIGALLKAQVKDGTAQDEEDAHVKRVDAADNKVRPLVDCRIRNPGRPHGADVIDTAKRRHASRVVAAVADDDEEHGERADNVIEHQMAPRRSHLPLVKIVHALILASGDGWRN